MTNKPLHLTVSHDKVQLGESLKIQYSWDATPCQYFCYFIVKNLNGQRVGGDLSYSPSPCPFPLLFSPPHGSEVTPFLPTHFPHPHPSSDSLSCLLIFSNVFMYSFKSSVCAEAGAACNCWRPKAVLFFLAECTRQSSSVIISSLVTDGTSRFSVLNRIHYSNVSSTDSKGYGANFPVSPDNYRRFRSRGLARPSNTPVAKCSF